MAGRRAPWMLGCVVAGLSCSSEATPPAPTAPPAPVVAPALPRPVQVPPAGPFSTNLAPMPPGWMPPSPPRADGADDPVPDEVDMGIGSEECARGRRMRTAREHVRARRFGAAAAVMQSLGDEAGTRQMQWLADTMRRLDRMGVALPPRPTRRIAAEMAELHDAPRAGAPPPAWRQEFSGAYPVDVWATLDGFALVAIPDHSPVSSTSDAWGLGGWVAERDLGDEPLAAAYQDVGRPMRIARPTPSGAVRFWYGWEQRCDACGEVGVFRVDPSMEGSCEPLRDLCGGPGIADSPPTADDINYAMTINGGCAHCATPSRTLPDVGSYCRAPAPGWTWQCGPGNLTLVCSPPAAP